MRRSGGRVFGYARVSSQEQTRGTSLRDQQDRITAHAKSLGRKVDRFYVEAVSAVYEKIEKREQIRTLMQDVQRGDLVLVDKIDRWSRDAEFSYRSIRELLAAGVSFYAVDERIDPSTPDGDSALSLRILIAREEYKRIVVRLVGTRRTIRDQGFFIEGTPPIGYKRGPGHTLTIDPEGAKIARRIFEMCAAGRSLQYIADHFDLWKHTVTKIVQNRLYLGEIQDSKGEWIRGKHEAIIDAALFLRAQAGRKQRKKSGQHGHPSTTDTWILRDVAYCGICERKMGSRFDRRGADRIYYRCNGCRRGKVGATTGLFIPVRAVEATFETLLLAHLATLKDELLKPSRPNVAPVDHASKKATLAKKRERWLHMYEDGAIDRERLRKEVALIDDQAMRLEPPRTAPLDRKQALRTLADIERGWRHATKKRAIVGELAIRVLLQPGKPPVPEWRTLADLLVEST